MRKNKIVGAIEGAGRPKIAEPNTAVLNLRVSELARQAMNNVPRLERGKLVDQLIREHFMV